MLPESWTPFPVLALRSLPYTVRQDCLQSIYLCPPHIDLLIHNQSRQSLPHPLSHHACLPKLRHKSSFHRNSRRMGRKTLNTPLKLRIAGKRQIVGVARICGSNGPRESR